MKVINVRRAPPPAARVNARCTAVADSVLMNSRTQKILCCIAAILLSTDAALGKRSSGGT